MDDGSAVPYHLLLLADPEKAAIDKYISDSLVFLAYYDGKIIGVFVLFHIDENTIELKNIAVDENMHRQGIGRFLLNYACRFAKENNYKRFIIGTGNSSINELYFYQKMGFEIFDIKKNFFLENYTAPIIENGIQDKHMLMLEKYL